MLTTLTNWPKIWGRGLWRVSEFDNVVLAVGFISCPNRTTHLTSRARTTELNICWLIITNPPYPQFYQLLHSTMDLIPAFRGERYYTDCKLFSSIFWNWKTHWFLAVSSSLPAAVFAHNPDEVHMHIADMSDFLAWSWPRSEEGMEGYRESIICEQTCRALSDAICISKFRKFGQAVISISIRKPL